MKDTCTRLIFNHISFFFVSTTGFISLMSIFQGDRKGGEGKREEGREGIEGRVMKVERMGEFKNRRGE